MYRPILSDPPAIPLIVRTKILTVDDSKTVRIIVKRAFRTFDCEIFEAANGTEGLASAAANAPDLILVDVTMPIMDGIEMVTQLKSEANLREIPIIMLTAEGGKDAVQKAAGLGVNHYIVKPFAEAALIEEIRKIVALDPVPQPV